MRSEEVGWEDRALPVGPEDLEPDDMKGVYKHPEFEPLPKELHIGKVNLSPEMTDPLKLFKLFFPHHLMETFVRATNEYAKLESWRKYLPRH